jgi:hypothetical protein
MNIFFCVKRVCFLFHILFHKLFHFTKRAVILFFSRKKGSNFGVSVISSESYLSAQNNLNRNFAKMVSLINKGKMLENTGIYKSGSRRLL